jgi:hypothetical protein
MCITNKYNTPTIILLVAFFLNACESSVNNPEPEPVKSSTTKLTLSGFEISNSGGTSVLNAGIIYDDNSSCYTVLVNEWLEDVALLQSLKAKFTSIGKVFVNGVEQHSSVTANDFRQDVVYTVVAEDNTQRNYTVKVDCPQATGLPVVKIDTKDGASITSKETYIKTNVKIVDASNENYSLENTGYNDEIRGRGNATWEYPKKPYRIKFNKKTSLFGLEKAKSWVLLAEYRSPTMLLNLFAFELGRRFSLPFTNHYIPVELFLNGSYEGTYILTEQVQVGEGRVDIDEDDGFLVEMDFHYDEDPRFLTNPYSLPMMIKSPEDLADPAGYDFVKSAMNELTAAIMNAAFPNNNYKGLIDVNTWVDYIMINDIVMNFELQVPASIYLYKDKGSKINMGPLWDFDGGYGYEDDERTFFREYVGRIPHLHRRIGFGEYGTNTQKFFNQFFQDPEFKALYKSRWNEKSADIASMSSFIDEMAAKLQKSYRTNCGRWSPDFDYNSEIQKMKTWLNNRVAYLDGTILTSP